MEEIRVIAKGGKEGWRRIARRVLLGFLGLGLVAAAASVVGVFPGLTVTLIGPDGRPLEGAYLGYHFKGYLLNLVDTLTYSRPGALARSDARGQVEIPGFVHLHQPLASSLRPYIDVVYVPALHNAVQVQLNSDARPGVVHARRDRNLLEIHDLSADPALWERSLSELYSYLRYDLMVGRSGERNRRSPEVPAGMVRDLGEQTLGEYRALLGQHGDKARTFPEPDAYFLGRPQEEQAAIRADQRESIARFPTWGSWWERLWEDRMASLRAALDGLP